MEKRDSRQAEAVKEAVATEIVGVKEYGCGMGECQPPCLQRCADIKIFVFLITVQITISMGNITYNQGTLRTVERRFGFSSQQMAVLESINNIVQTCLIVFIGYFASRMHKPRFLAFITIFSSMGMVMASMPYFVFGALQLEPSFMSLLPVKVMSVVSPYDYQVCSNHTNSTYDCDVGGDDEQAANEMAYYILVASCILIGFGSAGTTTIGMSFIEENSKPAQSGLYLGIVGAGHALGPIVGYNLAAVTTGLPEDLFGDAGMDRDDPGFIGCWWLGGLVFGTASFLVLFLMAMMPKHFSDYYIHHKKATENSAKENMDEHKKESRLISELKHFFLSVRRLFVNPAYVCIVVMAVLALYMIVGIFSNLARYMEIHFGLEPFQANVSAAICGALMSAIGNIGGGYIMKRFKLKLTGSVLILIAVKVAVIALLVVLMMLQCDHPVLQGLQQNTTREIDVSTTCSEACHCERDHFQPVCSDDMQMYFSPCHAGCAISHNETYTACGCTEERDVRLNADLCTPVCSTALVYLIVFAIMVIVASVARVPGLILLFRVVDPDLKAFALGIQEALINLLVFVPGPLIFGTLYDSACQLWQYTCGDRGACLLYDLDLYRYYMHGIVVALMAIALCFAIAVYAILKHRHITDEDNELSISEKRVATDQDSSVVTRF